MTTIIHSALALANTVPRKTPGSGGPRLSSFGKKTNNGDSMSPGDYKVADRMTYKWTGLRSRDDYMTGGGPSVAPNENAGRPDPQVGKKKRPVFTQRYYKGSTPHPDYLHGSPDGRRYGDEAGGSQ
jgi:hypothetical protein